MKTGPDGTTIYLPDTRPVTLAREFLAARGFDLPGAAVPRRPLRHWRGDFYAWDSTPGCVHVRMISENLVADVTQYLNGLHCAARGGEIIPLRVTSATVRETLHQLAALGQADAERISSWLCPRPPIDAKNVIAFQDGLIDASAYLGDGSDLPHPSTPDWFSESVLPCKFLGTDAMRCDRWIKFLDQAIGDPELIAILQEFFGYCLTGDTSRQAMLWLQGAPGAGKGTISRVLRNICGPINVMSFGLRDLIKTFVLSAMMGKRVAIAGDAHIGRDTDSIAVIDLLKNLSGDDEVLVDRKYREILSSVKMSTRFVICVNAFPTLPDASDALRRRSLIVPCRKGFTGEADIHLGRALDQETAAIVRWSLAGLRRLIESGKFTVSAVSESMKARMTALSSPVHTFIEEQATLRTEASELKAEIYGRYKKWAAENGHGIMSSDRFGESLLAAFPTITSARARMGGRIEQRYRGVELSYEDSAMI